MLLMPAKLPNSSYVDLVLNFILFIWGELSSEPHPSFPSDTLQTANNQKGREYTFCVLAEKGRRLLLQLFFTAVSWTLVHPLPGAQVWANPRAPVCPFGPGSMASTKTGPFTDSEANSKALVYDKWVRTSIGLVLILCLIPTIQDFQYKTDWTNTNVFCAKKSCFAESVFSVSSHTEFQSGPSFCKGRIYPSEVYLSGNDI